MALTRPKYSQIYDTDWKQSVKLATTGSDVGNLILGNTQPNSLDGVNVALNDRILVKDQTDTTQNGLYLVRNVGTGSNGWWTRTLDANQNGFVTSGLTTDVTSGTSNANRSYKLITQDPIYLGNTALIFSLVTASAGGGNTEVQFNDGGIISARPGFTYNKTSNAVVIGGNLTAGNLSVGAISASTLDVAGGGLNAVAIGQTTPAAGAFTSLSATGVIYANATGAGALTVAGGANIAGNIITSGYFLGNGSQLTGVITSVTKIINGNAEVRAYQNGNVTINPAGLSNVVTITNTSNVLVSGDINFSGNLYQRGNLFVSGGGSVPAFITVASSDFGSINDTASYTEDEGNVVSTASSTYDLGGIFSAGYYKPTYFTLPSYSKTALPTADIAGTMIFVTDDVGGSVPAFSDGTNWRRVTDRAVIA